MFIWKKWTLTFALHQGTKVYSRLISDVNVGSRIVNILRKKRETVREREIKNEHRRSHFKVKEWVPTAAWAMPLGAPGGPRRPCQRPPSLSALSSSGRGRLAALPTTGGKAFPATFPKTSRSSLNVLKMSPLQKLNPWPRLHPERPGPEPVGKQATLVGLLPPSEPAQLPGPILANETGIS